MNKSTIHDFLNVKVTISLTGSKGIVYYNRKQIKFNLDNISDAEAFQMLLYTIKYAAFMRSQRGFQLKAHIEEKMKKAGIKYE